MYIPRNRSSVRVRFWKMTRRDRARKFERPRRFRGSNMNHKKRPVDAQASPSIHASIQRSLVPPTALLLTLQSSLRFKSSPPHPLPCVNKYKVCIHYTVCKGCLRQINTCRKVPLQVNFFDDDILLWCCGGLLLVINIYLCRVCVSLIMAPVRQFILVS